MNLKLQVKAEVKPQNLFKKGTEVFVDTNTLSKSLKSGKILGVSGDDVKVLLLGVGMVIVSRNSIFSVDETATKRKR